jgi:glycine/D-amino acid oxidase-like deaminating enzyme
MPDPSGTASLPIPGERRGWWLREALRDEGDPPPAPRLTGSIECDVAIIGGGYTGMWTAYEITERAPDTRVVVLEQDICGGGPSGRNGGFTHGWWDQLPLLVDLYGADRALEIAHASEAAVDQIGEFCERSPPVVTSASRTAMSRSRPPRSNGAARRRDFARAC